MKRTPLLPVLLLAGALSASAAVVIQNGDFNQPVTQVGGGAEALPNATGSSLSLNTWYTSDDANNRQLERVDTDGAGDYQLKTISGGDNRAYGALYAIDGADVEGDGFTLTFDYTVWGGSGDFDLLVYGWNDATAATIDFFQFSGNNPNASAAVTQISGFNFNGVNSSGTFSHNILVPPATYDNIGLLLWVDNWTNGTATGGSDAISFDNFVVPAGSVVLPEPGTLGLLLIGVLGLSRRVRLLRCRFHKRSV